MLLTATSFLLESSFTEEHHDRPSYLGGNHDSGCFEIDLDEEDEDDFDDCDPDASRING